MQNKNTIKILVGYHKPGVLLKDEIFTPIHLGRVLATEFSKDGEMSREDFEWMCENMIGDDTGENISCLNRYFNELTGIYWAWKNYEKLDNPDYIGFMHYRRHFIFNKDIDLKTISKHWSGYSYLFPYIDDKYLEIIKLKNLKNLLNNIDIIIPDRLLFSKDVVWTKLNVKNLQETFLSYNQDDEILYSIRELLIKKKEFENIGINFLGQEYYYPANMFIMKKELFFEMCDFIFDICFKIFKQYENKLKNDIVWSKRYFAWGTEYLASLYMQRQFELNKNIKEYPISFVENTDLHHDIVFTQSSVHIVFAVDEWQLPLLSTSIQSLLENLNLKYSYEIYVLHKKLSLDRQNKIIKIINNITNVKIIFKDIDYYIYSYSLSFKCFNISEYAKVLIPIIFKNFKNLIYLECGLIILNDLTEIIKIDLKNKAIAAVYNVKAIDTFFRYLVWSQEKNKSELYQECKKNILKSIDCSVLYYNISRCKDLMNKIDNIEDDDALELKFLSKFEWLFARIMCNNIHYLHLSYNVSWHTRYFLNDKLGTMLPNTLSLEYRNSIKNPKIMHYNGHYKPWNNASIVKSELWWFYARKTFFYEEMILNDIQYNNREFSHQIENKIKKHLSYRLGNALIKNPLTFIFKVYFIINKWKKENR
ncbi:TPA: DUF4422 domain-containing protein [Campylobacter jejuni]|nr:DUF4422 domain-containing protein [Campylobacter jejuni]